MSDVKFKDVDEEQTWDQYASASLGNVFDVQCPLPKTFAAVAAQAADALLKERRKRQT
jgi:hypothetical protein